MRNSATRTSNANGVQCSRNVISCSHTQSVGPVPGLAPCFSTFFERLKCLLFVVLLSIGGFAYGQNTVGSIVGTATTSDGSVVPGAKVTVTDEGTHASRALMTGKHGEYSAPDLNPGTYTVIASAPGFSAFTTTGIVVLSQQTVRVDLVMKIGAVSTQVVVSGGAQVIETEMPSISTTVTSQEITQSSSNLLGTKDNTGDSGLEEYIALLPAGHEGNGSSWSMDGSTTQEAYYNVDGISSNSTLYGNADGPAFPSYDIVQEVKYDAVDNKAEMGQLLNITVITKSGTDRFQGSFFEHFGNENLAAQSYFSKTKPSYTDNDFGGGLGGPIVKRKFYFFAAYEGLRNNSPIAISPSVPTEQFRSGDFSSLLTGPNPTIIKNPYTGQPFPGNVITPSLLQSPQSQAAQKWQAMFYPAPNFGPPTGFNANFRGTYPQNVYSNRFDLRLDGNLSPKNTAFVRFSYNRASPETLVTGYPPDIAGTNIQIRKTYSGVISDTWAITPNLFNLFKAGAEWTNNNFHPTLYGQSIIDNLGIQGFPIAPANSTGFPGVTINNVTSVYQQGPANGTEQTNQVTDQLTWQHANHTIKGGVEYRPQLGTQPVYPNFGTFSFNGSQTGFAYADFLLGLPQATGYTYLRPSEYQREYFVGAFLQDDWRATPNLMISYGMRYDFQSAPRDKYDTISNFDPATGAIVVPSLANVQKYITPGFPTAIPILSAQQAGFPAPSLRNAFKYAIYPRIGFAYNINANTVLRGGYGVYNADLTGELIGDYLYQAPYGGVVGYTNTLAVPGAPQDPCSVATPCTPAITFTNPTNASTGKLGAININGLDKNLRNPFIQQWNLTLERNIGFNTGLRLSYVGSQTADLVYGRNLNQVPASATVPWSQANVLYTNYQKVIQESNGGRQSYSGFTVEANRRMKHNLLFDASLTWAKNLTDDPSNAITGNGSFWGADPEGGVVAEDTYNLSRQRGNDQYTPRLQFTSNAIYSLPIGQGQWLLRENNIWSKIFGGWQLSASYEAMTGQHLTPVFSGVDPTHINAFGGSVDRVSGVSTELAGGRTVNGWFNPAAYAVPQPGQFGHAGFGVLEGPGSEVLNAALFKSFPLPKSTKLDVSGSFSNVLNHPNFGNPDMTITDANAGKITGVQAYYFGPRSGLLSVRYSF